jgi:hypothetical protein
MEKITRSIDANMQITFDLSEKKGSDREMRKETAKKMRKIKEYALKSFPGSRVAIGISILFTYNPNKK